MKNRRFLSTQILLVALGIGLVWLSVREVTWSDVIVILRQLSVRELIPILLLNFGVLIGLTTRWWLLLRGFGFRLPFLRIMRYRTAVFALGYLTPGPQVGGEVLAVYYPTRHKVPASVALAAASVDKTLELLGNFTFIAIGSFIVLVGQRLLSEADLIALGLLSTLLLIPVALLVAIWRGRHPISGFMLWVEELAPLRWRVRLRALPGIRSLPNMHRLEATVTHSEDLIAWLCREHPWTLVAAIAATVGAWMCTLSEFWLVTHALGFLLTPAQAIGTLVLIYFAFTTPMPGGLGAVEAAILLAFTSFGFSPSQAVSLALFIRIRDLTEAAIGLLLAGASWQKLHSPQTMTVTADTAGLPPPPVSRRAGAVEAAAVMTAAARADAGADGMAPAGEREAATPEVLVPEPPL